MVEATDKIVTESDGAEDARSLQSRIRACYETLPSSERSVADLLLEFPGDIALCSATELASRAEASNAAVSRLIQRLGYASYREAQREVRNGQEAGHPLYLNNSLVRPADHGDSLDEHLAQDLKNLTGSLAGVSRTVTILIAAVWVLAFIILLLAFAHQPQGAQYKQCGAQRAGGKQGQPVRYGAGIDALLEQRLDRRAAG